MRDAIQTSVNTDGDRGMHVEYDNSYPFEYWNAGASWRLLPIYEYWQCYGNRQIPVNDEMRIDDLKSILSASDTDLTDEELSAIKERGYLDLEQDILLPLLTKQANFWEQIVTPRYYIDAEGNACHDENKTALEEGEKYMIIPGYSPGESSDRIHEHDNREHRYGYSRGERRARYGYGYRERGKERRLRGADRKMGEFKIPAPRL